MNSNPRLSYAIALILGGVSTASAVHAAPATDTGTAAGASDADTIQEITVTAQRRTENIQNVPITMQAITGEQLRDLGVESFDDVIKYLPNVTFPTNGPGQGNIYMRGLSAGSLALQSSSSIASFPNVAVYLDDQSLQFPSRNLDVYMVDMERLEVLEGPQGTLFGGGAEAGAIRYITNKPKLDVTEGNVEASYGTTAHGGNNSSVNATLNLPLIADTLAVRAVIYDDQRGGYIDNVPSTFTRKNSDLGTFQAGYAGACTTGSPIDGACPAGSSPTAFIQPPGSPTANNNNVAGSDINPVTYQGIRASAFYKFNDDWNFLLTQAYQNMEADGVFTQYPIGSEGQPLQPLQTTVFSPSYDKDRFENTAWTLNGRIGVLKAVYTGGYLTRHVDQVQDYTNYARGVYGDYYQCTGGGIGAGTKPVCYSPVGSWQDTVENTHQTHEFRLSTPDDWRARALVGAYWEDFVIRDAMNFNYKSIPSCTPDNLATALGGGAPCVGNVMTAAGSTAMDPGERSDSTAFGEDIQRGYKQTAFFASLDYDLIPKVLTLTGGTRWYHYSEFETGSDFATGPGCLDVPNGQCTAGQVNLNAENLHKTYNGFKSRGNLTWHITPDTMVYYTYSQGYRPGGFNRSQGFVAPGPDGNGQYNKPQGYAPDSLTNQEIGWKTEFFDHRIQVNGSAYHMDWNNVQVEFFDPGALGNTTFATNGPNYTINGLELQLIAVVTEGLTIQGSSSWNHAKQTNSPCLVDNNPASAGNGHCITEFIAAGATAPTPFLNPFGTPGSPPADSPPVQWNLRARYDWALSSYKWFVMAGANHVAHSFNQTANSSNGDTATGVNTTLLRYEMPAYTTFDATIGVAKDNWTVKAFGTNLSDSNASVYTSSDQFIKAETPLRPRVLGVTFGYKF
jgi:iron complex outermembrane receptor protein